MSAYLFSFATYLSFAKLSAREILQFHVVHLRKEL
jgi:hypothetical protein